MEMNYGNFENQTFEKLDGTILCSNFTNCTFIDPADDLVFEKCNISGCKFNKPCKFIKSVVVNTHTQESNEPVKVSKSTRAKTKAATSSKVTYIDDKTTDEALEKSTYEKSNYAFIDKTTPYYPVDRKSVCFENPNGFDSYLLIGETGIKRGNFKDNGEMPDIDSNYANALVETGMHAEENALRIFPYIKTTFDYLAKEGLKKKIKIDLSKIINSSNPEVANILTSSGIELREYYFTISNIDYIDDENKVMIVDLESSNETVHFQYLLDLRDLGGIALKLNTPIKGIKKGGTGEEILDNAKPAGVAITTFVVENNQENKNNG